MSASNWAVCPKCKDNRTLLWRDKATEAYGTIPIEDWDDLLRTRAEELGQEETFREDWEIYGASEGTIQVRYWGSCEVCDLKIEFVKDIPFYPEEGSAS